LSEDDIIESELKGKTLLVYMYLIKAGRETGVREIQRSLKFSSPSVASYHLGKLEEMGLIENHYGDYKLKREIKVGVLKSFVKVGGVMLPQYLFYAVLLTTMLLTFILTTPFEPSKFYITTLVMGLIPSVVFWYETAKIWRSKPS
jgi:hypothetical protein